MQYICISHAIVYSRSRYSMNRKYELTAYNINNHICLRDFHLMRHICILAFLKAIHCLRHVVFRYAVYEKKGLPRIYVSICPISRISICNVQYDTTVIVLNLLRSRYFIIKTFCRYPYLHYLCNGLSCNLE